MKIVRFLQDLRAITVAFSVAGLLVCANLMAVYDPLFPPAAESGSKHYQGQIIVGVRSDARPFSYRTGARHDEPILRDYGGYMIEICRRVLSRMTTGEGPFRDFKVVTRRVNVANRFEALDNGEVDLLCGPDSITPNRLTSYNVSHPVFLSGLTWATLPNDRFPQHQYCKPIIGLLARTTAETIGLQVLADKNELFRFDEAVEQYLAKVSRGGRTSRDDNLLTEIQALLSASIGDSKKRSHESQPWIDPINSADIVTAECPDGFESGPVVTFSSHRDGLKALCDGQIFYYLGDRDILKARVSGLPTCTLELKPRTITEEAYGIFFRRTEPLLSANVSAARGFPDSALQAEFNNVLLRQMQESANILDYEFKREFSPETPTEDLQRFFDSFKFASHHIRED